MKYANNITEVIANTPLIKLNSLSDNAKVFAKCEFFNPISIKDRPILNIIEEAEAAGKIKPGDTLIETTSGNTGMALSYIGALKGYKVIICMCAIQSVERRQVMKAFGAEIILTDRNKGTKGAKAKMNELLEAHPEYYYVGQHTNTANPNAHYKTTGPEIWADTDGQIDIMMSPLGTGGTICGAGRYLKEQNSDILLYAVEPANAPYISKGIFNPHRIMGTAPGFVPATLDKEIIDEIHLSSEDESFEMCRFLARTEGMLIGISSGAVAAAAKKVADLPENKDKVIVITFADAGQSYLSVKGLFDS